MACHAGRKGSATSATAKTFCPELVEGTLAENINGLDKAEVTWRHQSWPDDPRQSNFGQVVHLCERYVKSKTDKSPDLATRAFIKLLVLLVSGGCGGRI